MSSSTEKPSELITVALDWIYANVTSGSIELAESYRLKCAGDSEQGISDLIRSHVCYAAFIGFMTNFGGVLKQVNLSYVPEAKIGGILGLGARQGDGRLEHDDRIHPHRSICETRG